jgi:metal-dependent amidase/aminoacylase/carboxypeptidase family protein
MRPYVEEICSGVTHVSSEVKGMGSEDFAELCSRVPSMSVQVGAGSPKEGYTITVHNSKVLFDENCLVQGSALFASLAFNWLKDNT